MTMIPLPATSRDPRWRRAAAMSLATFALLAAPLASLHAQVGYPPSKSPYRDIPQAGSFTFTAGRFGGNGGKLGIGPHGGTQYGLRYELRLGRPISFLVGGHYADLERLVANPSDSVARRITGPVKQSVVIAEAGLLFTLTGAKTWHRLAPYVGVTGGLAFGSTTPQDTTGYNFGNKFVVTPLAGIKVYFTERLHLRGEIRSTFWQIKYPATFTQPPAKEPGGAPLITDRDLSQWTGHAVYLMGMGYAFRLF
ncbi:MAG: hypothetical protein ACOY71_04930 [Gemmatimonadota bacterium]